MSEADPSKPSRKEKKPGKRGGAFSAAYTSRPKATPQPEPQEPQPAPSGRTDRFASPPQAGAKDTGAPTSHARSAQSGQYRAVVRKLPFDAAYEGNRMVCLIGILALSVWAYWPALKKLVTDWALFVDYSHGFFVLPATIFFLWARRDTYPGTSKRIAWIGLVPILLAVLMRRHFAGMLEPSYENWSIFFWILGVVWMLYGTRTFRWALPSLLFLCFLFPFPYRFEVEFRQFLQEYASVFATGMLQLVGEPAVRVGNTIRLGATEVSVVNACSGLRFLISFFAIAAAACLLMRRPWGQNVFVFVCVVPIAVLANAARIALTALFMYHAPETMSRLATTARSAGAIADQIAGLIMIFVAVGVFLGILSYLGNVFREVHMPTQKVKS